MAVTPSSPSAAGRAAAAAPASTPKPPNLAQQLQALLARAEQLSASLTPDDLQALSVVVQQSAASGKVDTKQLSNIFAPAEARHRGAPKAYIDALEGAQSIIATRLDVQKQLAEQVSAGGGGGRKDATVKLLEKMTIETEQYDRVVRSTIPHSGTSPAAAIATLDNLVELIQEQAKK